MVKCSFCGREEHSFIGIHLINNDGTVSFFCSSKCRKNTLKLRRDRKRQKWTEAYRIARDKSIADAHKKAEVEKSEKKAVKAAGKKPVSK